MDSIFFVVSWERFSSISKSDSLLLGVSMSVTSSVVVAEIKYTVKKGKWNNRFYI